VVGEQTGNVNAEPENMRRIVEKLKAWSESLSPSEQVMLGLLLKRLDEVQAIDQPADDPDGPPSVE
jgi:hypothetical protein